MSQLQTLGFGSGIVWAFPNGGQNGSNLTPIDIGTIQNVKVDFTAEIKSLFGLNSFPVDTAIGKRSIKGTAAFAQLEFTAWNSLMFGSGGTVTAGNAQITSYREAANIPATPGPYTVSVVNAAKFVQDGGVRYASSGQMLDVVTTSPAAGQYSVSAGVYTFAAADQAKAVMITYSYSSTTDGQTFTISNVAMGQGPIVGLQLLLPYEAYGGYGALDKGLFLPNVRFGNLTLTTKLDDYTEENTSFEAFASPNGQVAQAYLPW